MRRRGHALLILRTKYGIQTIWCIDNIQMLRFAAITRAAIPYYSTNWGIGTLGLELFFKMPFAAFAVCRKPIKARSSCRRPQCEVHSSSRVRGRSVGRLPGVIEKMTFIHTGHCNYRFESYHQLSHYIQEYFGVDDVSMFDWIPNPFQCLPAYWFNYWVWTKRLGELSSNRTWQLQISRKSLSFIWLSYAQE